MFVKKKNDATLEFLRNQVSGTREDVDEKILRKLFRDRSLEVTSDTDYEEFKDWEELLEPLTEGGIYVRPLDYVDLIKSAVERSCEKVAEAETDYPATWEDRSSVELYYCTTPSKGFVVIEEHSGGTWAGERIYVHDDARSAVRAFNSTIDSWIETLRDHSHLGVPGSRESLERARELKGAKLKLKDVLEKIRF